MRSKWTPFKLLINIIYPMLILNINIRSLTLRGGRSTNTTILIDKKLEGIFIFVVLAISLYNLIKC